MSYTSHNQRENREIWAVVALKSADSAKSRLRPYLSEANRRALYFFMARRVLGALIATPGIAKVLVVTTCDEVASFAAQMGVDVIRQLEDAGTAAAFTHAVTAVTQRERPAQLLMIAGDLPLISTAALSELVGQSTAVESKVCVVPDRRRVGTNALLCSPPDAIPPCLGENSFHQHLAAARARGIEVRVVESEALSLDIDVAEDLVLLRGRRGIMSDPLLYELLAGFRPAGTPKHWKTMHDVDAA